MTTDDFDYFHPIVLSPHSGYRWVHEPRSGMSSSAAMDYPHIKSSALLGACSRAMEIQRWSHQLGGPVDTADTPSKRTRRALFSAAIASIGFTSAPPSRNRKDYNNVSVANVLPR